MAEKNSAPALAAQTEMDRHNLASNKAHQLNSLLSVMYGQGQEWVEGMGSRHRDNLLWIAADLADEIEGLIDGLGAVHV